MDKRGQGLSLNTIIVAIIVLIVLVVLIMIFTGYFGSKFTPAVTSCQSAGGTCETECGTDAFGNDIPKLNAQCPIQGNVCCSKGLGLGEKSETCGSLGQVCGAGQECFDGDCKVPCKTPDSCVTATDCPTDRNPADGACNAGQVCCQPV